ncbi:unnamed protein product [Schistosoma margrebowiei]|uniref:Uncharacterized protein n=1 Tax=Schistosoma margrebowiei TaxID=48269 RepID=A0A183MPX6_9TREM|nr:unnamed protein product [Schistosoma margrebowiei]
MESSRPKEKRKTKQHITPGNGVRHEKNEQELDGTRKEGPGQSGSHLMLIGALNEHMPKQSNSESHSKVVDTLNELTDTVRNSFVNEEEVNEFLNNNPRTKYDGVEKKTYFLHLRFKGNQLHEILNNVDSGQCSNVFSSHPSHSNYPVTSGGTNVSSESISDQIPNDVISDADYLDDSLVSNEVFNEFEKNVSNVSNSGDIITNVACSHDAFVSSEKLVNMMHEFSMDSNLIIVLTDPY